MLGKGQLCIVNPNLDKSAMPKKERNVLNALCNNNPTYFLILRHMDEDTYLVTKVFDQKKRYSHHIAVDGVSLWFRCVEFTPLKEECLIFSGKRLAYPQQMISKLYDVKAEIKEQHYRETKRREQKKREEKRLMKMLDRGNGKGNTKKYPYGSGIARRVAPGNSIHIISGGGVSPR